MNVFELTNPILVAEILSKSFMDMDEAEFQKSLNETCKRARDFISHNDSAFTSHLEECDATAYADHCRSFLQAFKRLEENIAKRFPQAFLAQDLAQVIVFWQVLGVFRTMHGSFQK